MAEEGAADPRPLGGTRRREAVLGKIVVVVPLHFTQVISERPPWTQSGALGIQTGGEAEGATPPIHLTVEWSDNKAAQYEDWWSTRERGGHKARWVHSNCNEPLIHSSAVESVFKGRRLTNRSPPPLPSHWNLTILQAIPPKPSFLPVPPTQSNLHADYQARSKRRNTIQRASSPDK
ncbi:hypothetical protein FA13DRAFT_1776002 [Coprinellus micaceus]|uniref:Uncharacterized protein n=1 Tax=Coprinellus micaceus TaxID=71717 RepID=A0A4Y7T477_COPMI|nr:hypothetical protein FA13DRAFT_1776002 [Coprinellus micaceus]